MYKEVIKYVLAEIKRYCLNKGARPGQGVNNFVPHDCVTAFAMAKILVTKVGFDNYISVGPEGHIYGYFFEIIGFTPLSVSVNYPPTELQIIDDLSQITGGRTLIIEDDIIGGATLRIVIDALIIHKPAKLYLFLGHGKSLQHLHNVPPEIQKTYIAEDFLEDRDYDKHEAAFINYFSGLQMNN